LRVLSLLLRSPLVIEQEHHPISPRWVQRDTYDRLRPAGTPSSAQLMTRYGGAANDGWWWACRSADGLLEDGRKRGPGLAWANTMRGRAREPRATRFAVQASIRGCAMALGYVPTSSVYVHFLDVRRKAARERGGDRAVWEAGWRSIGAVYQHYRDWPTALAAAQIDQTRLDAAAADRLAETARGQADAVAGASGTAETSPEALLSALPPAALAAAGFTEGERERIALRGWTVLRQLPLSRAVALAGVLEGSLDWLATRTPLRGTAPKPSTRFDGAAFRKLRQEANVHEAAILARARVQAGTVRRWGRGSAEPTLGDLAAIAEHCNAPSLEAICR
jgi:hypothetical protein